MVQFASLYGFVRTILIILLIYYGLKIITRLAAPFMLKYLSKKAEQRFGDGFRGFKYEHPPKQQREGEVTIDKMPNQNKSSNKEVGEYVDYEEID